MRPGSYETFASASRDNRAEKKSSQYDGMVHTVEANGQVTECVSTGKRRAKERDVRVRQPLNKRLPGEIEAKFL